jgi:outer membrane protein assembly factor BamB
MSDRSVSNDRPSWLRRLRVPLITFAVPLALLVALLLNEQFELSADATMPLFMGTSIAIELGIVVVAVWFLFFSGFRIWTKLAGVLVVALLVAAVYGIPRRWEFTGKMMPIPIFRWQPDLQDQLKQRLAQRSGEVPTLVLADLTIGPDDFPRYRGVHADGVAPSLSVPTNWAQNPTREVWRTPVGWSYSGIAVAGKVAVTLEQREDDEAVVCYDRDTGKELWSYSYPALFKQARPMGGNGPRATPTIADGDVYSLGAMGDLVCLDGTNGKKRWAINIVNDNGAKVVQWGMTSSPLIVGDLVVVNAGINPDDNQKKAVVAYERKGGKKRWAEGEHLAGYSSPMLVKLGGFEQIVLFDVGGVAGIDPADGKELWRYPWKTWEDMNIIQPLILPGDRVFISSQKANGCALLQVKQSASGSSVEPLWTKTKRTMACLFANPVYHDGHIYGLTDGVLCSIKAANGERNWMGERAGSGQLILTGNTLLVQTEGTGEIIAVAADPAEYRELGRVKVFQGSRTWNTPALAGGRLYLRNHEEMVCLELAR